MTADTAALAPRIASVEAAERIQPFGLDMRVMLDAAATGGTFSAIVVELKPGEGPPPHLHRDREEFFYVLDGTFRMMVDGTESTIGPGTLVFTPRNTVHSFSNIGTTSGRLLEWTIPGSNEPYFRAVHDMQGVGFDLEQLGEINRRFATEFSDAHKNPHG
jgi:mannose-6-phosphate isomerase-like protein (cupin superfamily)